MFRPITLTGARAAIDPEDGSNVIITLVTKHVGERAYALPREGLESFISELQQLRAASDLPPQQSDQLTIKAPKKWMVGSGLPKHPVVFVVFDPRTEHQAGYALDPAAAKEMATGLVKQAIAVSVHGTHTRDK